MIYLNHNGKWNGKNAQLQNKIWMANIEQGWGSNHQTLAMPEPRYKLLCIASLQEKLKIHTG